MNDKCKHGIELSTVCKDCDDEQADLIITKGLTMPPNNTPRTDKEQISVTTALMRYGERKRVVPAEVVKAIELELTEALKDVDRLNHCIDAGYLNELNDGYPITREGMRVLIDQAIDAAVEKGKE